MSDTEYLITRDQPAEVRERATAEALDQLEAELPKLRAQLAAGQTPGLLAIVRGDEPRSYKMIACLESYEISPIVRGLLNVFNDAWDKAEEMGLIEYDEQGR